MTTLGDIVRVNNNISQADTKVTKALHIFCFGTVGDRQNRRRLRQFPGFTFGTDSDEYTAKIDAAVEELSAGDLISICNLLNLDYAGEPEEVATRICKNLIDLQRLGEKHRGQFEGHGGRR